MADISGTLWENSSDEASMNHAFEAHIVTTLYRDILGLYKVDYVNKKVHLRFTPLTFDWCEGSTPTPDGFIHMRWNKTADGVTYQIDVPAGYQVDVETVGDVKAIQSILPAWESEFWLQGRGGYQ